MAKRSDQTSKTEKKEKRSKADAVSVKAEPIAAKPKKPSEIKVTIQSVMGGDITMDEIIARVHASAPDAEEIYVKAEENRAYYVGKANRGFVVLWE